jgi:hypothetical protein
MRSMKTMGWVLALWATGAACAAHAADCPIAAQALSSQLGQNFKVVTQDKGLLGNACEYANDTRSIKVAIDEGPNPAPSAEMWRKMANPPKTVWKAVAGDPDKAVLLESYPNGDPYPAMVYERKGRLVQINVMGVTGKAAVDQWNSKLLKLSRIPQ